MQLQKHFINFKWFPKTLLTLMGALLFNSCAVKIQDEEFYVDAGSSGAITSYFLHSGSTIIPINEWNAMREGMICVKAKTIGDFKREIEELCSQTACDYQTKAAISLLIRVQEVATNRKVLP